MVSHRKPNPYRISKYYDSMDHPVRGQAYLWATKDNIQAIKDGEYSRIRPVAAEFDLSTQCVYNCPWCAYRESKKGGITLRDDETALRVVQKLASAGVRLLVLTGGGEPLLSDVLERTISESRRKGMYVTLYTNGCLLDRIRSEKLLASGVSEIRISLNDVSSQEGYEKAHGAKNGCNLSVRTITDNLLDLLRARAEHTSRFSKGRLRSHVTSVGVSFVMVNSSVNNLPNSLSTLASILKKSNLSLDYTLIRPAVNYWPGGRIGYNKYLTDPSKALHKVEAAKASSSSFSSLLGEIMISLQRFNDMNDEEKGPSTM